MRLTGKRPIVGFPSAHQSRFQRDKITLNLNVISIRHIPFWQDHPSSLIQVLKFSERPLIVPPEVRKRPPR